MYSIFAYITYLVFSAITVLVVGKILHNNGKVFLFGECPDEQLSTSANNFLYTCYCLINIGFAFYFLNTQQAIQTLTQVIEFLCYSEGIIFTCLGFLHTINTILVPRIMSFFLNKKMHRN